jgi:flagellar motor switch protein FliN/FliY
MSDENQTPDENEQVEASAEENQSADVAFEEMSEEEENDESQDSFAGEAMEKDLDAIYDIPVKVSAVLGHSSMQVSQLLKLGRGALITLDRRVGEPVDVYVNNRLVARGEVVINGDKLGITMTEIIKSENRG